MDIDAAGPLALSAEALARGSSPEDAAAFALAVTDNMADGLYVADAEDRLLFVNPAAARALGCDSSAELLGRGAHATLHHILVYALATIRRTQWGTRAAPAAPTDDRPDPPRVLPLDRIEVG